MSKKSKTKVNRKSHNKLLKVVREPVFRQRIEADKTKYDRKKMKNKKFDYDLSNLLKSLFN